MVSKDLMYRNDNDVYRFSGLKAGVETTIVG